ncbi:MAG: hypothetical protein Q4B26_20495 [Eubacteriales bacterium]|nr:hypothetical protein [Eubacteriales bacterium]
MSRTTVIKKKCPHCGHVYSRKTYIGYGKVSESVQIEYGTPLLTCLYCGKPFLDRNRRELVWTGMPEDYYRKVTKSGVQSLVLSLIMGIFFLAGGLSVLGLVTIVLGVVLFLVDLGGYEGRKKKLDDEMEASKKRTQNPAYVLALKLAGYNVPSSALERISQMMPKNSEENQLKEQKLPERVTEPQGSGLQPAQTLEKQSDQNSYPADQTARDIMPIKVGDKIQCPTCGKEQPLGRMRCFFCGQHFLNLADTEQEKQEALRRKQEKIQKNKEELNSCLQKKKEYDERIKKLHTGKMIKDLLFVVTGLAAVSCLIYCLSVSLAQPTIQVDKSTYTKYSKNAQGYVQAEIRGITELFEFTTTESIEGQPSSSYLLEKIVYMVANTTDGDICVLQCGKDAEAFEQYIDDIEDREIAGILGLDNAVSPVVVYGHAGEMKPLLSTSNIDQSDVFMNKGDLTNTEYYNKLTEYPVIDLKDSDTYVKDPAAVKQAHIGLGIFIASLLALVVSFLLWHSSKQTFDALKWETSKNDERIQNLAREIKNAY